MNQGGIRRRPWALRGEDRFPLKRAIIGTLLFLGGSLAILSTPNPASAAKPPPELNVSVSAWMEGTSITGLYLFGGDTVQYKIDFTYTGASPSDPVSINDMVPNDAVYVVNSATCGSVPNCTSEFAGTTLTFNISSVAAGATDLELSFEATLRQGSEYQSLRDRAWGVGAGCTKCFSTSTSNFVEPRPVGILASTGNDGTVQAGTLDTYYVIVRNNLGIPWSNVVVNDPVPQETNYIADSASCGSTPNCTSSESGGVVTFTFGAVPAHAGKGLKASFEVLIPTTSPGPVVDNASWSSDMCAIAPCATNTLTQAVEPPSLVTVTKAASSASVDPGQELTYTLSVTNSGVDAGEDVLVTDVIPNGTAYVSGSASCGGAATCLASKTDAGVQWTINSIAAGATDTLTFSVTVNASASGSIVNTAAWTGAGCVYQEPAGSSPDVFPCPTNTVTTPVGPDVSTTTTTTAGGSPTTTTTVAGATSPNGPGTTTVGGVGSRSSGNPPTSASSGSLAFTGVGQNVKWTAVIGAMLVLLGLVLLVLIEAPRRVVWRFAHLSTRRVPEIAVRKWIGMRSSGQSANGPLKRTTE